jgi:hypothetical protein
MDKYLSQNVHCFDYEGKMSHMFLSRWKPKYIPSVLSFEPCTVSHTQPIFLISFLTTHYRPVLLRYTWRFVVDILKLVLDPTRWSLPFLRPESGHPKETFR